MEEIGVLGLVVGLWIALSAPKRATGIQDRLAMALAWTLVALAVLLALTATLELPSDTTGAEPSARNGSGLAQQGSDAAPAMVWSNSAVPASSGRNQ